VRQLIVWTVLVVAVVLPTCAFGEEAPVDEIVAIERGQRAPFDGQLFPTEVAIRLGMRVERLQLQLTADVEREQDLCRAQLQFEERRLQLEQERRDFEIEQLTDLVDQQAEELVAARTVPWYRTWGFAFGMGIVASLLLVGGSVALMVGLG